MLLFGQTALLCLARLAAAHSTPLWLELPNREHPLSVMKLIPLLHGSERTEKEKTFDDHDVERKWMQKIRRVAMSAWQRWYNPHACEDIMETAKSEL